MKSCRHLAAPILFLAASLAAFLLAGYAVSHFRVDSSRMIWRVPASFDEGWQLEQPLGPQPLPEIPRSLTLDRGCVTLTNCLPEDLEKDAALCFLSDSEDVELFVDGAPVYSYGKQDRHAFGGDFGTFWCLIPLHSDYAGREISLTLTSRGDAPAEGFYHFYLDDLTSMYSYFLLCNAFLFASAMFCISLGLIFILLGLHRLCRRSPMGLPFLYLGLTALMIDGWALCDANVLQLMFHNRAVIQLVKYLFFFLICVPLSLFLSHVLSEYAALFRGFCMVFSAFTLFSIAAYCADLMELRQLLPFAHLLMCALAAATVTVICRVPKIPGRLHIQVGLLCFIPLAVVSLVLYLRNPHPSLRSLSHGDVMVVGTNLLLTGFLLFSNKTTICAFDLAKQYEAKAMTDALTGIGNRAALELCLNRLDDDVQRPISLFMIDLDNLKQVNDSDGHEAGDRLLLHLVSILKETFSRGALFRYGGDEFVVLLEDEASRDAPALGEFLSARLYGAPESRGLLRASVGLARRTPGRTVSAHRLLRQADANMYADKARHKAYEAFSEDSLS